jgi:glyoxylase-like metal-dependent hydrolase (beta-lactamase superfamily II)
MEDMDEGIQRITLELPVRPGHVHTYLLDGTTLVDTGLGLPDAAETWRDRLEDMSVERIVITHFHPDHVGAAMDVAGLTGAPVFQGALDYAQCIHVWDNPAWGETLLDWFVRAGTPQEITDDLVEQGSLYRPFVRFVRDPHLLYEGDELDGWRVLEVPGHADGHIALLRDGMLVSADFLLDPITPAVGWWPDSRPDPLGDYLGALARVEELAPRVAYPGHGEPITDPVGRARELIDFHARRLDKTEAALGPEPRSGYDVSLEVFGRELRPAARRFAVAETLSHLERLVHDGRAARAGADRALSYTGP